MEALIQNILNANVEVGKRWFYKTSKVFIKPQNMKNAYFKIVIKNDSFDVTLGFRMNLVHVKFIIT